MTLNGVMAIILRYFIEFRSFRDACRRKKVHIRYLIPDEFPVTEEEAAGCKEQNTVKQVSPLPRCRRPRIQGAA